MKENVSGCFFLNTVYRPIQYGNTMSKHTTKRTTHTHTHTHNEIVGY